MVKFAGTLLKEDVLSTWPSVLITDRLSDLDSCGKLNARVNTPVEGFGKMFNEALFPSIGAIPAAGLKVKLPVFDFEALY